MCAPGTPCEIDCEPLGPDGCEHGGMGTCSDNNIDCIVLDTTAVSCAARASVPAIHQHNGCTLVNQSVYVKCCERWGSGVTGTRRAGTNAMVHGSLLQCVNAMCPSVPVCRCAPHEFCLGDACTPFAMPSAWKLEVGASCNAPFLNNVSAYDCVRLCERDESCVTVEVDAVTRMRCAMTMAGNTCDVVLSVTPALNREVYTHTGRLKRYRQLYQADSIEISASILIALVIAISVAWCSI